MTEAKFTPYMGLPVRQAGVEIPNAAGGLQAAMKIDPQEHPQGTKLFVVLEVVVQKHRHEPIDDAAPGGDQRLVHVMKATGATFVDEDLVRAQLDQQKARIALAKDDTSGQQTIEHAAELELQHFAGKHKRLKADCPKCDEEKRLAAQEKEAAKTAKAANGTVKPIGSARPRRSK